MTLAYNDIRDLHESDKTPAEIVAALKASDVTQRPVLLNDLMDQLNKRGVLTHLAGPDAKGRKWEGSFINLLDVLGASGTQSQISGAKLFFAHITNDRNVSLDLTEQQFSAIFRAMESAFADLVITIDEVEYVMPSQADFDAISDLGGGWKYRGITEEAIEATIQEHETQAARESLESEWAAIQNDGGINEAISNGNRAALVTALQAAAVVLGEGNG